MFRIPSPVAIAAALVFASAGAYAAPPPGKGWTKKVPPPFSTAIIPASEACVDLPAPLPAGFEVVLHHAVTADTLTGLHKNALVVSVAGDLVTVCLAEGVELLTEDLVVRWKFGEPDEEPEAPVAE